MAYPVATLQDGSVLYSDGSKRKSGAQTNPTPVPTPSQNNNIFDQFTFTPGGTSTLNLREAQANPGLTWSTPRSEPTNNLPMSTTYDLWSDISPLYVGWGKDEALADYRSKGSPPVSGAPQSTPSDNVDFRLPQSTQQNNNNWRIDTNNLFSDSFANNLDLLSGGTAGSSATLRNRRPSDTTGGQYMTPDPNQSKATNLAAGSFNPNSRVLGLNSWSAPMSTQDFGELENMRRNIQRDAENFRPQNTVPTANDVNKQVGELFYAEGLDPNSVSRDAAIAGLEQQYAKRLAHWATLKDQYNVAAQDAVGELSTNLERSKEAGAKKKDEVSNTYAKQVREQVKNQQNVNNKLRNLFSRLGTAESSAFIDEYGQQQRGLMSDIRDIETDKSGRLSTIDQTLLDYEQNIMNDIAKINRDKDAKIAQIEMDTRLSEGDKLVALQQINADWLMRQQEAENAINSIKAQQIMDRANFADQLGLIYAQGNVQDNLLRTQYNMEARNNTFNQMIPPELDQQLRNKVGRPSSSIADRQMQNQLMTQYPEWADLIRATFEGELTSEDDLNRLAGGARSAPALTYNMLPANYISPTSYQPGF